MRERRENERERDRKRWTGHVCMYSFTAVRIADGGNILYVLAIGLYRGFDSSPDAAVAVAVV
jgi:hypothetical protein